MADVYVSISGQSHSGDDVAKALRINGAWRRGLREFVRREVAFSLAQEAGISVSDEELQQNIDAWRKAHGLHDAASTHQFLTANGLALEDLERDREGFILAHKLRESVDQGTVQKHFEEHKQAYEQARLSVIDVETEAMAAELMQQVEEGEASFEQLARNHSLDRASRMNNGYVGWRARGRLPETDSAKIFAAGGGALAGPFPTQKGFRIYRVEETQAAELDGPLARIIKRNLQDQHVTQFIKDKVKLPEGLI